jgi:hypothetical protein
MPMRLVGWPSTLIARVRSESRVTWLLRPVRADLGEGAHSVTKKPAPYSSRADTPRNSWKTDR